MRIAITAAWIFCTALQAATLTQTLPLTPIPPSLLRPIPSTGGVQPADPSTGLSMAGSTAGGIPPVEGIGRNNEGGIGVSGSV